LGSVILFVQTVQQMDGQMDLTKPVASRDFLQINSKLFYGSTTNTNTHLCPLVTGPMSRVPNVETIRNFCWKTFMVAKWWWHYIGADVTSCPVIKAQ